MQIQNKANTLGNGNKGKKATQEIRKPHILQEHIKTDRTGNTNVALSIWEEKVNGHLGRTTEFIMGHGPTDKP